MTKKEFYEKIAGKEVEIIGFKALKLKALKEKNSIIKEMLNCIKKEYWKDLKMIQKDNGLVLYLKEKNELLEIGFRRLKLENLIKNTMERKGFKTKVLSKEIVVDGCYWNKTNIVLLENNTFTNKFLQEDNIIYKILE